MSNACIIATVIYLLNNFKFMLQVLTLNVAAPPVTTESSLPEVPVATQSVQSSWHLQFNIPELDTFSGSVKDAVKTGLVTSIARREIIQVLRTYVTKHTRNPTSEQYVTICQKLIGKFPNLKDTEGDSPFVSTECISL